MVVQHTIALTGPGVSGGRPLPGPAGSVLRLVGPLVEEAVSVGFRRPSQTRGRKPDWLRAACDVRYVGISRRTDDATLFHFEAPRFGDAAAEVYRQGELFSLRPDAKDTGFDILGDTLSDIANKVRDSERFDARLLRTVNGFRRMAARQGVDCLALHGDRLPGDAPPMLDAGVAECAIDLYRETPVPRRARVAGKLDMIRDSDCVFVMLLDDGTRIRGLWADTNTMVSLGALFGKFILAEGQAVFRPSGSLLRLEADAMELAREGDRFFSKAPTATSGQALSDRVRQRQGPNTGAAAIYGKWPGDESEEELLAALEELRR